MHGPQWVLFAEAAHAGKVCRMELSEDGVVLVAERLRSILAERSAVRVIHEHIVRQADTEPRRHRAFAVVVLLAEPAPEVLLVEDADRAPYRRWYVHAEPVCAHQL